MAKVVGDVLVVPSIIQFEQWAMRRRALAIVYPCARRTEDFCGHMWEDEPGGGWGCTREVRHKGPHVAHGVPGEALALWFEVST